MKESEASEGTKLKTLIMTFVVGSTFEIQIAMAEDNHVSAVWERIAAELKEALRNETGVSLRFVTPYD